MFAFRMQLKELFALFSMMSLNVPLAPTGEEMESRFENEQKLKLDLFENYDGTMFPKLTRPLMVQPMMTIDHIRSINEEQGAMTISMTLYFIWTDSRLQWNRTEYGGIKAFAKNHYENMAWNIWSPTIFITELPGVNTQTDLFLNHDVDFLVHYTGSVTATIKVLINTPCLLSFGDYPNDYQNCSLTLMTPYTANV
uniref:Neur_chan_LBD domain-containing protein n=1 Tax=Caenorhabditis japonica TaxID=281687 RepID=A0A8R1HN98_CAEJA